MSCCLPSSSGGICAFAEMPSARKPIFSDSASATTPRTTGTRSSRWRFVQETSGSEITSISPFAPSLESGPPSASCSAEGLRTATAQVEMPRIITPSSTAWPPMGASLVASLGFHRVHRIGGQPVFLRAAQVSSCALSASELSAMAFSGSASSLDEASAVRPADHEHALLAGCERRDRHGVDDVAVDGQPDRHARSATALPVFPTSAR